MRRIIEDGEHLVRHRHTRRIVEHRRLHREPAQRRRAPPIGRNRRQAFEQRVEQQATRHRRDARRTLRRHRDIIFAQRRGRERARRVSGTDRSGFLVTPATISISSARVIAT